MSWPLETPLTVALATTFALSLFSWGRYALYPLKLFTTWAHECAHAAMALVAGGSVERITLSPDTSGLTEYQLPPSRLRQAAVASSGYLGSCAAGCAIYALVSTRSLGAGSLLQWVAVTIFASVVFWVRNAFGVLALLALGVALFWAGSLPGHSPEKTGLVLFLALQTALNALHDLRALYGFGARSGSDAHALQKLFWLPAWFWATFWMLLSVALIGGTAYLIHR